MFGFKLLQIPNGGGHICIFAGNILGSGNREGNVDAHNESDDDDGDSVRHGWAPAEQKEKKTL
jgi:hypothetical protein